MVNGNEMKLMLDVKGERLNIPFVSSTLRQKRTVLDRMAAIEGTGFSNPIIENSGTAGGFTTTFDAFSVSQLFTVMFGRFEFSDFVSETRNIYRCFISLQAADNSERFKLVEERGVKQKECLDCYCKGFDLRIRRGETIKAHLDIESDTPVKVLEHFDFGEARHGERFAEHGVTYSFLGSKKEPLDIYGATLSVDKRNGCRAFLTLNRVLHETDFPEYISGFTISARVFRDKLGEREHGKFVINLTHLRLVQDETDVNTADAVIGPLRYAVCGEVWANTFYEGEDVS